MGNENDKKEHREQHDLERLDAGYLALYYALMAENATDVEEAMSFKCLSDRMRGIVRSKRTARLRREEPMNYERKIDELGALYDAIAQQIEEVRVRLKEANEACRRDFEMYMQVLDDAIDTCTKLREAVDGHH